MAMPGATLRILSSVEEVSPREWDAVAQSASPILRWHWLRAFEASGSASARTGWQPHHFTLWRAGRLVAFAPAYVKHHSLGEYIYDFAWADAARSIGVDYYPKLLVGVPLSPVTAPRFSAAPGEDVAGARERLLRAAVDAAKDGGMSSVHVLFVTEDEAAALESLGLARRWTMQLHWRNAGYRSYDEFLSRFDARRRHQLRRERAAAAKQGITVRTVRGGELSAEHAELAWRFYESTNTKHAWGRVQLNRQFFREVFETMPDSIEMVLAERDSRVIAGAFNLATKERLYGRYWGAFEEVPFLHFHVCLYHSIDECIRLGRSVFEAGAGGEHKLARGFEPTAVHSAHLLFDRRLDRAVRDVLRREREAMAPAFERSAELAGLRPLSR